MDNLNFSILNQLLEIPASCSVVKWMAHDSSKTLDIWIDLAVPSTQATKHWWSLSDSDSATPTFASHQTYSTWRHLNVASWKTNIHCPIPLPQDLLDQPFAGKKDEPFSQALFLLISKMLHEGISLAVIGVSLDIAMRDIWRYRDALINRKMGHTFVSTTETANISNSNTDSAATIVPTSLNIPLANHPVWKAILSGSLILDIKTLSLNLLLAKIKNHHLIDDQNHTILINDLVRYFDRNQRFLHYEISQIKRGYSDSKIIP